jgi:hypothetical protein
VTPAAIGTIGLGASTVLIGLGATGGVRFPVVVESVTLGSGRGIK